MDQPGGSLATGRWLLTLCAVAGIGLGCGNVEDSTSGAAGPGVRGVVLVGPQCPVEQAGTPCPPAPLSATVVLLAGTGSADPKAAPPTAGEPVVRGRSGPDGRFELTAQPGDYVVSVEAAAPITCTPVAARVPGGGYTDVTVTCDSGIR